MNKLATATLGAAFLAASCVAAVVAVWFFATTVFDLEFPGAWLPSESAGSLKRVELRLEAGERGVLEHASGVRLQIPRRALRARARVSIAEVEPPPATLPSGVSLGPVFDVSVGGASLERPVTLTIPYDAENVSASDVRAVHWDDERGGWELLEGDADEDEGVIEVEVSDLSPFSTLVRDTGSEDGADVEIVSCGAEHAEPGAGEPFALVASVSGDAGSAGARMFVEFQIEGQASGYFASPSGLADAGGDAVFRSSAGPYDSGSYAVTCVLRAGRPAGETNLLPALGTGADWIAALLPEPLDRADGPVVRITSEPEPAAQIARVVPAPEPTAPAVSVDAETLDCGLASEAECELAGMYAPVLVTHPDERYLPRGVEGYVYRSELIDGGLDPGAPGIEISDLDDLGDAAYGEEHYLDLDGRGDLGGFPPDWPERVPTVYAAVRHGAGGVLYLQYHIFYYYDHLNPAQSEVCGRFLDVPSFCDPHEADWELIQLEFRRADSAATVLDQGLEPEAVAYSQHGWSEDRAWGSPDLEVAGDSHPVAYAALGKHANYFGTYAGAEAGAQALDLCDAARGLPLRPLDATLLGAGSEGGSEAIFEGTDWAPFVCARLEASEDQVSIVLDEISLSGKRLLPPALSVDAGTCRAEDLSPCGYELSFIADDTPWAAYQGLWGGSGKKIRGPGHGARWDRPWEWAGYETDLLLETEPAAAPTSGFVSVAAASGRIAFTSKRDGDNEIYVMNADGSGVLQLTDNDSSDQGAAWSPDGRRIAFESHREGDWDIYVMNEDGSEQTRLSDDVGSDGDPVWSPDGLLIAFVSLYRENSGNPRRHQLRVMNADGTEQNAWVSRHKDELGNPTWSPDGRRIAFEINDSGDNPEIAVVGAGPVHILTDLPEAERPDWSPDGLRIVFHAVDELDRFSTPEHTNIYLIDPEGKEAGRDVSWHRNVGLVDLTDRSASDWDPKWSPDGRRIVFSSNRDGDSEIYVMNADGSGIAQLTDNTASDFDPIWSSDGKHIAFLSGRDSEPGGEIYIMNADGSDQTRLTYNQHREYEIAWSPLAPTETSDVDIPRFEMEWDVSASELKADESFTLTVRMHGIQQPGEHGGISVSFPTLTSSGGLEHHHASAVADVEVVEYTTGTSNVKFHQSGATIYHREDNRQFSAEYLLVEADDATWSASADRTLVLRVTPKGEGDFPIQIRGWLCADKYESCRRDPVDGTNVDQQGYSVRHTSITVRSPQSTASNRIAFSSASGELYVINSDGTAMTRVAANGVFSWDGTRVAVATFDFLREDIEKDSSGNDVIRETAQYDISVMDADGSNSLRLTDSAGNDQYPSWSPGGTTIAFVSDRDHEDRTNDVYTINADGSGLRRLTDYKSRKFRLRWSPDGKRVAFQSRRQGEDSDVFVMGSDGSNLLRLTDNPGDVWDAVWSPDGQRIAFESDRDGNDEIYVMGADGSNPQRLTVDSAYDIDPAWSPDGQRIAFTSNRGGSFDVYTIRFDGSDLVRLTDDPGHDSDPSWSPDGRLIAFSSDRDHGDGTGEIYIMNTDGTRQIRLTDGSGVEPYYEPSWVVEDSQRVASEIPK